MRCSEMHSKGCSSDELVSYKEGRMKDVWRMLCIHLGTPPTSFDFQYRDKDKVARHEGMYLWCTLLLGVCEFVYVYLPHVLMHVYTCICDSLCMNVILYYVHDDN